LILNLYSIKIVADISKVTFYFTHKKFVLWVLFISFRTAQKLWLHSTMTKILLNCYRAIVCFSLQSNNTCSLNFKHLPCSPSIIYFLEKLTNNIQHTFANAGISATVIK